MGTMGVPNWPHHGIARWFRNGRSRTTAFFAGVQRIVLSVWSVGEPLGAAYGLGRGRWPSKRSNWSKKSRFSPYSCLFWPCYGYLESIPSKVGNDSVAISLPSHTRKRSLPDGSVALFFLVESLSDELFDECLVTLVPSSGKGPDPLKGRFIKAHGHILGLPARGR
jgi:hypothetical protein